LVSHEGDTPGILMEFYTLLEKIKKAVSIFRVEKPHGITPRRMLIANFTSIDRRSETVLALTYI